jgi:hypothetical protein
LLGKCFLREPFLKPRLPNDLPEGSDAVHPYPNFA